MRSSLVHRNFYVGVGVGLSLPIKLFNIFAFWAVFVSVFVKSVNILRDEIETTFPIERNQIACS